MLFYISNRGHTPRDLPKVLLSLALVVLIIGELEITRSEKTGFINSSAMSYVLVRELGLLETKVRTWRHPLRYHVVT